MCRDVSRMRHVERFAWPHSLSSPGPRSSTCAVPQAQSCNGSSTRVPSRLGAMWHMGCGLNSAGACPMCRIVGLSRALSYRSLCAVPQSSNSIETGPWTELHMELHRSPPCCSASKALRQLHAHNPRSRPTHRWRMSHVSHVGLGRISLTGARVPCLKARIPSRLGHGLNSAPPPPAVLPCAMPMDHALRPPAWLCVHARDPCT